MSNGNFTLLSRNSPLGLERTAISGENHRSTQEPGAAWKLMTAQGGEVRVHEMEGLRPRSAILRMGHAA